MNPGGETVVDATSYTLSLAVFDAVPVLLAAAAYVWAARALTADRRRRGAALAGAVLVTAGGAAKVAWKITIAASGTDITWLDDLLFPLLTPGLVLLGAALSARASLRRTLGGLVAVLAVALAVTLAGRPAVASALLIATMTAATVWVAASLARRAREVDAPSAVALVWITVAVAFLLAGLARFDQTIALQWVEEVTNALAQGALLAAVAIVVARGRRPGAPPTSSTTGSARGTRLPSSATP